MTSIPTRKLLLATTLSAMLGSATMAFAAPAPLFKTLPGKAAEQLPEHVTAGYRIKANRQSLLASEISFTLPNNEAPLIAVRTHLDRRVAGVHVWTGHIQGDEAATVIITFKGMQLSGLIQWQGATYRLSTDNAGKQVIYEIDLDSLPSEEPDGEVPTGDMVSSQQWVETEAATATDNVIQDLLVAYTQGACNYAGSCAQLEADIVTAIADLNNAYAASGINVTMNLVGTHLTDYTGTNASETLTALRLTSDGIMDDVHGVRDSLGADVVSLIYDGQGCGIGYLGSSASSAFNVTDVPCMVGNRTLAHEIGHNQGAHHDRQTVGGGVSGAFNYGFRRCGDGSIDDKGSPYFRTVMSYSCLGASRVGRFSNPLVSYAGVPQGVDPAVEPDYGAWNARTLNESAAYVASFRSSQVQLPPLAPSNLTLGVVSFDSVELTWNENADNESSIVIQRRQNASDWASVATLAANSTAFTDTTVSADSTYEYRVRADNSAGVSPYSNTVVALTASLPAQIDDVAVADIAGRGQVSGNYTSTHDDDSVIQTIEETSSGGPKRSRRQAYEHTWQFYVTGGAGGVTLSANAWVSGEEGANFTYSTDGGASWQSLFTVSSQDSDNVALALLPDISGNVLVRASDAQQSNGEAVDSLFVDTLVMTSSTEQPVLPAAPTALSVAGVQASQVTLQFTDNADNESGFVLRRSLVLSDDCAVGDEVETAPASTGTGFVAISDQQAVAGTRQYYWVASFNGAGNSVCSNRVEVVTESAPAQLSVTGYKVKGTQHADLTWDGLAGTNVDIYRDGQPVVSTGNDGSHTDNIGQKGGGSYVYQVCEQGSQTACTSQQTVTF